ncbi:hypothetical protein OG897_14605 [Streptomyces sp. NBC_00237]|uniref:hypothetical protein n=1 Tax=Streptomyces sp. NBC_00237 TaxID=2975687 RepID=UPI002254DB35|nr:hypothetical protein [Streptomyces sp. NBC_00237]MCX5202677.1 hypothetical protein [Streptomyces sp. NBC_00237]
MSVITVHRLTGDARRVTVQQGGVTVDLGRVYNDDGLEEALRRAGLEEASDVLDDPSAAGWEGGAARTCGGAGSRGRRALHQAPEGGRQAAGRLRVPVAAFRWAAHTGQVPAADAGPGLWTRTAVESVDAEAVRAALRGPVGASTAADRLTAALGTPLPALRPAVTSRQIGDLARAGLLTVLGTATDAPDIHPDQVAVLARRRDLAQLLDRHLCLGPEQAAIRLGVRRTDLKELRRLLANRGLPRLQLVRQRHYGWRPTFSPPR